MKSIEIDGVVGLDVTDGSPDYFSIGFTDSTGEDVEIAADNKEQIEELLQGLLDMVRN